MTPGEQHLCFWTDRLDDPSCVYVIQGDPDTPIKVGFATDVRERIAGLQTGNPQILRLLEVVPGDRRLEWNFHQRLREARVHGEWFAGPMVDPFLGYVRTLAWCMRQAYDGSGRAPHYTDFDTFASLPERAQVPPTPRTSAPRLQGKREAVATPEPQPAAGPSPETQALWTRIGQMWIGGATRSEIRGAEGLSADALEDVIWDMRANGYELAEGLELRRGANQTDRGPGKFRVLGRRGHRRPARSPVETS